MRDRLRRLRGEDSGVALITVLMAIVMMSAVVTLLLTQSIRQLEQAEFLEREDIVLAGTEAMLERYATKMTLDPLYYLHTVDESERARVCDTVTSLIFGVTVQPGNAWSDDCTEWTYVDTLDGDGDGEPDWYVHPLLVGTTSRGDVATLLEVTPPSGSRPLEVAVVGRRGSQVNRRMITASIEATALSEFVRVTELDLNYGSGAELFGKVYSGGNIDFWPTGIAHANVYAEGSIVREPNKANPSVTFYDGNGEHNPIRDEIPQPLNFSNFWDDLDLLAAVACDGGTLCLDDTGTAAWMVHPYMSGTVPRVHIWRTTSTPSGSCVGGGGGSLTVEEWLWLKPEDPSVVWIDWGDFEIPDNGALWANAHVVVGSLNWATGVDFNGVGGRDSVLGKSLTIYAGTAADRQNVIVNADLLYEDPASFATLGLIASDEIILNPLATGTDNNLYVNASLLAQTAMWRVAQRCGTNGGSAISQSASTLTVNGSIATPQTGSISGSYGTRNYLFDERLQYLRPPFYPLLDNDWTYENWREVSLPAWAQP